jgi:hypothetical protein
MTVLGWIDWFAKIGFFMLFVEVRWVQFKHLGELTILVVLLEHLGEGSFLIGIIHSLFKSGLDLGLIQSLSLLGFFGLVGDSGSSFIT